MSKEKESVPPKTYTKEEAIDIVKKYDELINGEASPPKISKR